MADKQVKVSGAQIMQAYETERAKMESIIARLNQISGLKNDISAADSVLESLGKAGKGGKVKLPVGAGIYVDATIDDPKLVGMALAGNIMLPAATEAAREELAKRLADIEKALESAEKERQFTAANLDNLGRAINVLRQNAAQAARRQ
ncbi:MAG: prefoldin domain-containing protein [Candidatus Diapherotrites archaeon]